MHIHDLDAPVALTAMQRKGRLRDRVAVPRLRRHRTVPDVADEKDRAGGRTMHRPPAALTASIASCGSQPAAIGMAFTPRLIT